MTLEELGYNEVLEAYRKDHHLDSFDIGRIISEHKDRYTVKTESDVFECELIGSLRFMASDKNELPAVGDWVAISEYDDNKALIHAIYPRKSIVERKAVATLTQTQVIAANIDFGIIVQSVNRDFSINRLERYLAICNASRIEPIIIVSKADLLNPDEVTEILTQIKQRIKNVPIIPISNQNLSGIDELKSRLITGKTYCFLGSSGVGKSTLINTLIGAEKMDTGEISDKIDRGKHVTSHRELIVFDNGILIDNPGMREVGITNSPDGLEITFDTIHTLSQACRFNDCTHTKEKGCAVLAALEAGELDADSYANFIKMGKEKMHFESNAQERKRKDKELGKMIKGIQKQRRNKKY